MGRLGFERAARYADLRVPSSSTSSIRGQITTALRLRHPDDKFDEKVETLTTANFRLTTSTSTIPTTTNPTQTIRTMSTTTYDNYET